MLSNPEDRKALLDAVKEISNCYTKAELERLAVKDIVSAISEKLGIPARTIRKISRLYHKQNFNEEQQSFEELESLYSEMTSI